MSPAALLADLRSRGIVLIPAGDALRCRAPRGVVTPDLAQLIREHKPALLALLLEDAETSADLLAMPLDVFAREGRPLEIRVPWWPTTLWFAPGVADAEALTREGIARHLVWTSGELCQLLTAAPLTTDVLITVMLARQSFGGDVVGAHRTRERGSAA